MRLFQNKMNYRPAIMFEQNYGTETLNQNMNHHNSLITSPLPQLQEVASAEVDSKRQVTDFQPK